MMGRCGRCQATERADSSNLTWEGGGGGLYACGDQFVPPSRKTVQEALGVAKDGCFARWRRKLSDSRVISPLGRVGKG